MQTADESGQHAELAARYVHPTMIENLQDLVRAAACDYAYTPPLDAFRGALSLRDRIYRQLDLTGHPQQQTDLFLAASQTCSLLAVATFDLGYANPAQQHARSALTYGQLAGDTTAQAFAHAVRCTLAFWSGQPTRGIEHAQAGLQLRSSGTAAVRLHAVAARCSALRGDRTAAVEHMRAAEDARGGSDPMCDEIGGEFGFSPARTALSAGASYLALDDGIEAARHASKALELFATADAQERWISGESGARTDLVTAHVLGKQLDQAAHHAELLIALPSAHRTERLIVRVQRLQTELTRRGLARDPRAMQISAALEEFVVDSLPRALPSGII